MRLVIPAFDENGFLPPGIHPARLDEIRSRFGSSSELRRVQMDSIMWMVDIARRAGIGRIVLNGSFTTDILEPNDVDCVLLTGQKFPMDEQAVRELRTGLPFLDVSIVDQSDFEFFVHRFFVRDRLNRAKGMIEVIL